MQDDGRRLYEQSLNLYRGLGDQWEVANVLNILGDVVKNLGNVDEGQRMLEEGLAIHSNLSDKRGMATALWHLSWNAWHRWDLTEGERLARESIAFCQEIGDKAGVCRGLWTLAANLLFQDKLSTAAAASEESLSIALELGNRHQTVWSSTSLAHVMLMSGRYEQARDSLSKNLIMAQELENRHQTAVCLIMQGRVALAMEAYAEAEQLSRKCLEISKEWGDRPHQGRASANLGYALFKQGYHVQARQYLTTALRLTIESQASSVVNHILSMVAAVLADSNQSEQAVELYALVSYNYLSIAHKRPWFQDVFGRYIDAAADSLSPKVIAAAQERGKARDLWETAEELLAELAELGWNQDELEVQKAKIK